MNLSQRQVLRSQDFHVVAPDYRGYADSSSHVREKNSIDEIEIWIVKTKCGTEISQWKQIICLIPGGAHWNRGGSGCQGSLWMGGCQVLFHNVISTDLVDSSKYVISTDSVTSKYLDTLQSKRPAYNLGAQFGHRCFLPPGDHHVLINKHQNNHLQIPKPTHGLVWLWYWRLRTSASRSCARPLWSLKPLSTTSLTRSSWKKIQMKRSGCLMSMFRCGTTQWAGFGERCLAMIGSSLCPSGHLGFHIFSWSCSIYISCIC